MLFFWATMLKNRSEDKEVFPGLVFFKPLKNTCTDNLWIIKRAYKLSKQLQISLVHKRHLCAGKRCSMCGNWNSGLTEVERVKEKISSALSLTFQCFSFISVQMKMDVHSGFDSSLPNKVTVKKPSALKVQKIRSVCAFYFLQWGYSLFAPALINELEGVCLRPLIRSISIRITMKENSERSSEENMSRRIFRARKGGGRDLRKNVGATTVSDKGIPRKH